MVTRKEKKIIRMYNLGHSEKTIKETLHVGSSTVKKALTHGGNRELHSRRNRMMKKRIYGIAKELGISREEAFRLHEEGVRYYHLHNMSPRQFLRKEKDEAESLDFIAGFYPEKFVVEEGYSGDDLLDEESQYYEDYEGDGYDADEDNEDDEDDGSGVMGL